MNQLKGFAWLSVITALAAVSVVAWLYWYSGHQTELTDNNPATQELQQEVQGNKQPATSAPQQTQTAQTQSQVVKADFTATPVSGSAPLTVRFSINAEAAAQMLLQHLSSLWRVEIDFGDGQITDTDNSQYPTICDQQNMPCTSNWTGSHTYTAPGTYVVRVGGTCGRTNCEKLTWVANATIIVSGTQTVSVPSDWISLQAQEDSRLTIKIPSQQKDHMKVSIVDGTGLSAEASTQASVTTTLGTVWQHQSFGDAGCGVERYVKKWVEQPSKSILVTAFYCEGDTGTYPDAETMVRILDSLSFSN